MGTHVVGHYNAQQVSLASVAGWVVGAFLKSWDIVRLSPSLGVLVTIDTTTPRGLRLQAFTLDSVGNIALAGSSLVWVRPGGYTFEGVLSVSDVGDGSTFIVLIQPQGSANVAALFSANTSGVTYIDNGQVTSFFSSSNQVCAVGTAAAVVGDALIQFDTGGGVPTTTRITGVPTSFFSNAQAHLRVGSVAYFAGNYFDPTAGTFSNYLASITYSGGTATFNGYTTYGPNFSGSVSAMTLLPNGNVAIATQVPDYAEFSGLTLVDYVQYTGDSSLRPFFALQGFQFIGTDGFGDHWFAAYSGNFPQMFTWWKWSSGTWTYAGGPNEIDSTIPLIASGTLPGNQPSSWQDSANGLVFVEARAADTTVDVVDIVTYHWGTFISSGLNATPTEGSAPLAVTFDVSTNSTFPIASYFFDTGDGHSTLTASDTWTYTYPSAPTGSPPGGIGVWHAIAHASDIQSTVSPDWPADITIDVPFDVPNLAGAVGEINAYFSPGRSV